MNTVKHIEVNAISQKISNLIAVLIGYAVSLTSFCYQWREKHLRKVIQLSEDLTQFLEVWVSVH